MHLQCVHILLLTSKRNYRKKIERMDKIYTCPKQQEANVHITRVMSLTKLIFRKDINPISSTMDKATHRKQSKHHWQRVSFRLVFK